MKTGPAHTLIAWVLIVLAAAPIGATSARQPVEPWVAPPLGDRGEPEPLVDQAQAAILPAAQPTLAQAGLRPPHSALLDLVQALGQERNLSPRAVRDLVQSYFRGSGYPVASSAASAGPDVAGLEENATLTYPFNVGDVNRDGNDDVAFDMYCVDLDACLHPRVGRIGIPPTGVLAPEQAPCDIPHRLLAVDGARAKPLWGANLSESRLDFVGDAVGNRENLVETGILGMCGFDFVVGTVPNGNGTNDLLVYSFSILGGHCAPSLWYMLPPGCNLGLVGGGGSLLVPLVFTTNNTVRLVRAADGKTLWRHTDLGYLVIDGVSVPGTQVLEFSAAAHNFIVQPVLYQRPALGVGLVANGTRSALFLDSLGYNVTYLQANPRPGARVPDEYVYAYWPDQWATRLDLGRGTVDWTRPVFHDGPELHPEGTARSVMPYMSLYTYPVFVNQILIPPFSNGRFAPMQSAAVVGAQPLGEAASYWNVRPCCFDVTGDTEPDLVYLTLEWNSYPMTSQATPLTQAGPFYLASRLVAFNGTGGQPAWEQVTESQTQMWYYPEVRDAASTFAYYSFVELVGDANGDGANDILLHKVYYQEPYRHVVSMRDGKTGQELWRIDSPREIVAVPLGGKSRTGHDSLALFDWFNWEFPFQRTYQFANVTATRFYAHDGLTGQLRWRGVTFNAPIDLLYMLLLFKESGMPDLNHDGAGDLLVDDPVRLPDLTVVHQLAWLSGDDGTILWRFPAVGTFSFPCLTGDVTGDDVDDVSLLSGDIADLWVTEYSGSTGAALWSHRVLTPKLADYAMAVPSLGFLPLRRNDTTTPGLLVNVHMSVTSYASFIVQSSVYPQIVTYAANGTFQWAHPEVPHASFGVRTDGPTPATKAFERVLADQAKPRGIAADVGAVGATVTPALPFAGLGVLSGFAGVFGGTKWIARRRLRLKKKGGDVF